MNNVETVTKKLQSLKNSNAEPKDILNVLLPNMQIISVNDILCKLNREHGTEIGKEFVELVVKNKFPEHRKILINFLKKQSDFVSLKLLEKLTKIDKILKNATCTACDLKNR